MGASRGYDRKDVLARAENARKKGRKRAAIGGYRELLAVDSDAPEVHARLAPLLARTGQHFDAWLSFRAAAEGFMRTSAAERALSTYYEAAHHLPRLPEVWKTLARMQCARGKQDEALRALRQGRKKLSRRKHRAEAIYLLRSAHEIDPWNAETVLDLARLLWLTRQRSEALLLLEALAQRVRGKALRATRGLQFRIAPHPRHAWLWLQAWRRTLNRRQRSAGTDARPAPNN